MSAPELDLHIDRLVLHDLPSSQRDRVAAAIVAEIERLVAEQGLPLGLAADAVVDLPSHAVSVAAGLNPEAIGVHVAQSVFSTIAGGPSQPVQPSAPQPGANVPAGRSGGPRESV